MGVDSEILFLDPAADITVMQHGLMRVTTPGRSFAINDPASIASRIHELCRNGSSRSSIVESFSTSREKRAAGKLLDMFISRRILTDVAPVTPPHRDPFRDWIRHTGGAAEATDVTVNLAGDGCLADAIETRLRSFGINISSDLHDADHRTVRCHTVKRRCMIAAFDSPRASLLREMNREALAKGCAFLPVWLKRAGISWGPLAIAGATGCYECLIHRERAAERRKHVIEDEADMSVSPAAADLGAILASTELLNWVEDAHISTDLGMAWQFDLLKLELKGARVLRLPRCPVCGTSQIRRAD